MKGVVNTHSKTQACHRGESTASKAMVVAQNGGPKAAGSLRHPPCRGTWWRWASLPHSPHLTAEEEQLPANPSTWQWASVLGKYWQLNLKLALSNTKAVTRAGQDTEKTILVLFVQILQAKVIFPGFPPVCTCELKSQQFLLMEKYLLEHLSMYRSEEFGM